MKRTYNVGCSGVILLLVIILASILANTLTVYLAWVWFFEPLGAPHIHPIQVAGVAASVRFFVRGRSRTESSSELKAETDPMRRWNLVLQEIATQHIAEPFVVSGILWVLHALQP